MFKIASLLFSVLSVFSSTIPTASAQVTNLTTRISSAWPTLQTSLSVFETHTDLIVPTAIHQAYSALADKTNVQLSQQIPSAYWPTFVKHQSTNLMIPPERLQNFNDYFGAIPYSAGEWTLVQTVFSTGKAKCSYVMICTYFDPTANLYSWVSAIIDGGIALPASPLFAMIRENPPFTSSNLTFTVWDRPVGMKDTDLSMVLTFSKMITFHGIALLLDVNLPPFV
jgi:hypothetical protein